MFPFPTDGVAGSPHGHRKAGRRHRLRRYRRSPRPGTSGLLRRARLAVAVTGLAVTAGADGLQAQPGALATRAACHRALAEWTLGRTTGPRPFHLHPAAAGLLATGAGRERADVGVGVRSRSGVLRAGETVPTDDGFRYPGPVEEPRRSGAAADLVVREAAGRLALVVDATIARSADAPVARLGVRTGDVVLSGGRGGLWPGNRCSSGLVLSGRGRPAGIGVDTEWIRLPLVGRLSLSGFVGTLREGSSDNRWPFFLAQRAVWPLGDDVRLGLTRAAIFGGRGGAVAVTPRTVALMLLGITDVEGKDSDFENQVASVDLAWRVPAGASAVRLHLEYAADDFSVAFLGVPALAVGADLVSSTGADGVRTVGAELVWIAPSAGTFPEWYRHGALAWGWTDRGVLLGHDLGGQGWGLRAGAFTASDGDEYAADVLVAHRGSENLLAPRAGGWGVEVRSEGRVGVGSWVGGRMLVGWHLRAGRLGDHGLLSAGVSAVHRF